MYSMPCFECAGSSREEMLVSWQTDAHNPFCPSIE